MANHHFGEIADVWKHLILAELLSLERPRRYWETHAGSAAYPLTRSWEREYGIYRFAERAAEDPVLASSRYFASFRISVRADAPARRYLGSASLAMSILGDDTRYLLCDLDPASVSSLGEAIREFDVVDVARSVCGDGLEEIWHAARSLSTDQQARTDVLIDPFDLTLRSAGGMDATELFRRLAAAGSHVMLWYGYDSLQERDAWLDELDGLPGAGWHAADLETARVRGATRLDPGAPGSGVLLANQADDALDRIRSLGEALSGVYADALMPDGTPGDLRFTMIA